MFRKTFCIFNLVIIFILLASLSGADYAQAESHNQPVEADYPAGYQPPVPEPMSARSHPAVAAASLGDGKVRAQAAVLGKPGTAFAHKSTTGTSDVPYIKDTKRTYIYTPKGLTFDASDQLYVVEEYGGQLMKFKSNGDLEWTVGKPGIHDWAATGLNFPAEVTVAPDGQSVWVADHDIASQFNVEFGSLIQHFPAQPWNPADDNYRFYNLTGIAFDSAGRMYLADRDRKRIQVFNFDGSGNPTYAATIDGFVSPAQIAIDASDNLYVVDVDDFTVKKCTPDTAAGWPWDWSCSVFFGASGVLGGPNDNAHLGYAYGLGIDRPNHMLFIADSSNGRVIHCPLAGACSPLITSGLKRPVDIAVKPSGNHIFVSDWDWNAIQEYVGELGPGTGDFVSTFIGDPNHIPYETQPQYFNLPTAVEVDTAGNQYIVEQAGNRLTKVSSAGIVLWSRGHAGLSNDTNNIEDPKYYMDWPRSVAVDRRNNVIVGGNGSHVRIYNALSGDYKDTLDQGRGGDDFQFLDVWGVATDSLNRIYVADAWAHLIKVFSYNPTSLTKKFTLLRTIGLSGDCGNSNSQFCSPRGIALDAARNLYVTDYYNCRVQKFDSRGVYKQTFGSGQCGSSFSRLGGPVDVAVDALGRVYVAEEWNNRVQIFDKTGAYLATIGGNWGVYSGSLRNPRSVAVDKWGNAYVADWIGARVQKFTPTISGWRQVNINGFGNKEATNASALAGFKGRLYAGGTNKNGQAAIWRRVGTTWQPVMDDAFEDGSNIEIDDLEEYKGYLYATTLNCTYMNNATHVCNQSNGGQIWRSPDGISWKMVAVSGFSDQANAALFRLGILGGRLCTTTWTTSGSHGAELWCSPTGEVGSWLREAENGLNDSANEAILAFVDYNNGQGINAYAATENRIGGAQVRRKVGSMWVDITGPWHVDSGFVAASALAVYKGYLYTLLVNHPTLGGLIYRCKVCDGSDWVEVVHGGLGNKHSRSSGALEATPGRLYAAVSNYKDGAEVWTSTTGEAGSWEWTGVPGMGTSNNQWTHWDSATVYWASHLYVGINNLTNGASVWMH